MTKTTKATVAIVMGSDSDYQTMQAAADALDDLNVNYEMSIVSAHRTPTEMATFATGAAERGIRVIIAGAGGAAHLPGMIAAHTTVPVIGVPVSITTLNGLDSLLSIVQMPKGVPVATMSIGGAFNAGLLAAQILAHAGNDDALRARLEQYRRDQHDQIIAKSLPERPAR